MGAIGSAAPWFLTGWAHDVEIEFMTDSMPSNNFVYNGVSAHVHCEPGGVFRIADLPTPVGISGLLFPDGTGPVRIRHCVSGTVL